ncbi:hypothetical protein [Kitasatospora sp. NPDC059327]|uniref:hypothetical protein n=1 Tax=Kitasatospora sp. NPDC059327 TaxID=3346803 RepID=UPI00369684F0
MTRTGSPATARTPTNDETRTVTPALTIYNEADSSDAVAERVERLLRVAAPLAERHSRLPLPTEITVSLVHPDGFVDLMAEHAEAAGHRAAATFPDDSTERAALLAGIEGGRTATGTGAARSWPGVRAATALRLDGSLELVVIPAALSATRATDRNLVGAFTHELTHCAQLRIWPTMPWQHLISGARVQVAGLPQDQTVASQYVFEGHAQWVQRNAMVEYCGQAEIDRIDGEPVPSNLLLLGQEQLRARRGPYDVGEAFMAALDDLGGHDLVLRLLTDPDQLPTIAQITGTDPAVLAKTYADTAAG